MEAADRIRDFLRLMESRALDEAEMFMAPGATIIFPGDRRFASQREMVAAARGRYQWIKKRIKRLESWPDGATTVVYVLGTLYGVNRHGVPFDGVRFVDRFEVRDGAILRQEVWNDLAEAGVLKLMSES